MGETDNARGGGALQSDTLPCGELVSRIGGVSSEMTQGQAAPWGCADPVGIQSPD